MKQELTIEEKIDRYLANELSTEERDNFEKLIAQDFDLRGEVELMRHITVAFEQRGEAEAYQELASLNEKELKTIIEKVEQKYKPTKQIRHKLIWAISAAAAVIILIFIGFQPKYSSESIYAEFHAIPAYQSLPPSRGGTPLNAEQEQELGRAIEFYNEGNFVEAASVFDQVGRDVKQEELPDDMVYYWAISLNEAGHLGEAMQKLGYLSKLEESEFKEDAMWQLALVLLKTDRREEAVKLLKDISTSGGKYNENATVLIEKMQAKRFF